MKNFPVERIIVYHGPTTLRAQVLCSILFTGPKSSTNMGLFYPKPGERVCHIRFLSLNSDDLLSACWRPIIKYESPCEFYFGLIHLCQIYEGVRREGLHRWECSDDGGEIVREGYL